MQNDYDVSIFIVTDKGYIVDPDEFDKRLDGMCHFIMLTNDILNPDYNDDNTICIYYKWQALVLKIIDKYGNKVDFGKIGRGGPGVNWQNLPLTRLTLQTYSKDSFYIKNTSLCFLYGYRMTNDIIMSVTPDMLEECSDIYGVKFKKEDYIPAIMGAYNTTVKHQGNIIHGYLPDIGLLKFITENVDRINDVIENKFLLLLIMKFPIYYNFKSEHNELLGSWYSCREVDDTHVMYIYYDTPYTNADKQHSEMVALPLFKLF